MTPETPYRIEPTLLDPVPTEVADAMAELSALTSRLASALHPQTARSLAKLVRIMNAHYSNLIEGHNTRPRDIVRALAGQFDEDEGRRNLQLEAAAHVKVQELVDDIAFNNRLPEPASEVFIKTLHQQFYAFAPIAMLTVQGRSGYVMTPGEWRREPNQDIVVGRHQPPSGPYVDSFMQYFQDRYKLAPMGMGTRIMAMAAAHHRFNYIHPFPDGNGRVSRLMSHAMAHAAGIGAHGLWSVSRGLARGLNDSGEYKRMMDLADSPRDDDFDGRGNLSLRALIDFVLWFLKVCIDQVEFMTQMFELHALIDRLRTWAEQSETLKPEVGRLLEEAAVRGEFDRGEVARITGMPERSARRVLADAIDAGFLASETPKGPVSLRFPASEAEALFPRLFQAGH